MTLISVTNVGVFDGISVTTPRIVHFRGSPGNITSSDAGLDSDPSADLAAGQTEVPDSIIDGSGCTLLPGLIDTEVDSAAASLSLETFASFGIATVIDMSSSTAENQAMRAASAAEAGLPSYLACGTVAVGPGSETSRTFALRSTSVVRTPEEAEAFVASRVNGPDNSDYIKVMVEVPGIDEAVLSALVDAAHHNNRLAVAHTAQAAAVDLATRAGFDVLTHAPVDGTLGADTVAQLAARGAVCVPLLYKMRKATPRLRQAMRDRGPLAGGQPDFANALATVKRLHEAGVPICAGTGATEAGEMTIPFGHSLHEEMGLLVQAGLSNLEVLRAVTSVSSKAFRLHDRGRIDSGLRADLLLVEGNPLEDISATRRIRKAWIRGIEVDPVQGP